MKRLFGLLVCIAFLFSCGSDTKEAASTEEKTASASPVATPKDYEFGDDKYVDIAKKALADLVKGDVDSYLAPYADDAVYRWNNFDSLAGKAAIADYWKKRRTDVIDSMEISSEIWMPINVKAPLTEGQKPGNYALCWYVINAKYKTGKSMKQRMHMVFHFNADDKIDLASQYIDRVPVIAATEK